MAKPKNFTKVLDVKGEKCPMPIVKAKQEMDKLKPGEILKVLATDPGSVLDFQGWVKVSKSASLLYHEKELDEKSKDIFTFYLKKN